MIISMFLFKILGGVTNIFFFLLMLGDECLTGHSPDIFYIIFRKAVPHDEIRVA